MEFLVPEYQSVVTIQVYVVDQQGRNVFSFVLNSHHKIFAEARKASAPLKAVGDSQRTPVHHHRGHPQRLN